MLRWALVPVGLFTLACVGPSLPPPPPPTDLAEDGAAWCRTADPSVRAMCATFEGRAPPQGLYLGLSFDTDAEGAATVDGGGLSILVVRPDGVGVGGVIPPQGAWDVRDEAERAVRACIRDGCPGGPTLSPAFDALLEAPYVRWGTVVPNDLGHVHAETPAGHGFAGEYDLVFGGGGWWMVSVDEYTSGIDEVNVYLRTPYRADGGARRGGQPDRDPVPDPDGPQRRRRHRR